MLNITPSVSGAGVKKYFRESLAKADYYVKGSSIVSEWGGKGATLLGLNGVVTSADFCDLVDNIHPVTGKQITQRNKKENSRVGYDFTFSPAGKGVSVLHALGTNEDRQAIEQAFDASIKEVMERIEQNIYVRVRRGKKNEDRKENNLLYAGFDHDVSRPVEITLGKSPALVPMPHLHRHVYVMNLVYDHTENQWKAGEFSYLMKDRQHLMAMFDAAFAQKLQALGYPIEKTKTGFDVVVPQSLRDRFSLRRKEIIEKAQELHIKTGKLTKELGAKTRNRKSASNLTSDELRQVWRSMLTEQESEALANVKTARAFAKVSHKQAIDYALSHHLERASVVKEKELLTTALNYGLGFVNLEGLEKALAKNKDVLRKTLKGESFITTRHVLEEEQKMIALARAGRGAWRACANPVGKEGLGGLGVTLNDEQLAAINHILTSKDQIISIQGRAGAGKTTLLRAATEILEQHHYRIFAFAPSSGASRGVQRDEGWANAETVKTLLVSDEWQRKIAGQVILVDESGLLGSQDMLSLVRLARRQQARLILVGDTSQLESVPRGSALRILQDNGGVASLEVAQIQRQKGDYKKAVEHLSKGEVKESLGILDKLGWIKEASDDSRYSQLAEQYAQAVKRGETALLVTATHAEGRKASDAIRQKLKQEKLLGADDYDYSSLQNLQLTQAQKQDVTNYQPGMVAVFHQNAKGFQRGEKVKVIAVDPTATDGRQIQLEARRGVERYLPLGECQKFALHAVNGLKIASGEKLRITANGFCLPDASGHKRRLNNGDVVKVESITAQGDLKLDNGAVIAKDFGHIASGYFTIHAAQGKTVDWVGLSGSAANLRQLYVALSRGRKQAMVFTDNKSELLSAASDEKQRLSATELMKAATEPPERKQRTVQEDQQKIAEHHLRVKLRDNTKNAPVVKAPLVVPGAEKEPVKSVDVPLAAAGKHTQKLIKERQKPKPDVAKATLPATMAKDKLKRKRQYDDRER